MNDSPLPTLDDFVRCDGNAGGCIWNVLRPATRCSEHSDYDGPEYAEADDGTLISARHMEVDDG